MQIISREFFKKFPRQIFVWALGLSLLGLGLVAGCSTKESGPVIARYDGKTIRESELVAKIKSLSKEMRSMVLRHRKEYVEELINERFLIEEARRQGLEKDPDVKELIQIAQDKIVVAKLIENEVDKKVTLEPGEALKYYEDHRDEFKTPLMLRASHILVKTEEEAKAIKSAIDTGADFEELARSKSMDHTALRGGDLGFFQKGQLIPEFEEVAFNLKKGEVSDIFKTPFGYHIVKLTDRAESAVRYFGLVRGLVEKELLVEKRSQIFKNYIEKLKKGVQVEIDEKKLEAISIAAPAPAPVKPEASA